MQPQKNDTSVVVPSSVLEGLLPLSKSIRKQELRGYLQDDDSYVFENYTFQGPFSIYSTDPNPSGYVFDNCTFENHLIFNNPACEASFYFRHCNFTRIDFNGGNYHNTITFDSCIAEGVELKNGEYQELSLSFNNCNLSVSKGSFKKLVIGSEEVWNSRFHHITIDASNIKGDVSVQKLLANSVTIKGNLNADSILKLEECQVNHMFLSNFKCSSKCILDLIDGHDGIHGIRPAYPLLNDDLPVLVGSFSDKEIKNAKDHYAKSLFTIENTDLENVYFLNIDFTSYNEVNVFKSRLTEIQFSNVVWPKRITTFHPLNSKFYGFRFYKGFLFGRRDYLDMREVYRQLKYACAKQHDFVGEQHFHSLEMKAYDKTLQWYQDFWTKMILKLSYWTSNFGQSVIRPLLGIIVVNGLLFYLLYLTGDGPFKGYDFTVASNYVNTAAEFIRFVNPLHRNEPELSGWAFIVDVLIRICSSYFIYNLIRATRRFVR